jgi:hypothetical protein
MHASIRAIALALATTVLAAPLVAQTHPDFSGTWKQNETNRAPTNLGPREVVFTIDHRDPQFKYDAKGRQANYAAFAESYAFTTDGRMPAGDAKVKVVGKWEGDVLTTRYLVNGEELSVVKYRLSPDGKQMFREMTMKGKPLGTDVYDKQ